MGKLPIIGKLMQSYTNNSNVKWPITTNAMVVSGDFFKSKSSNLAVLSEVHKIRHLINREKINITQNWPKSPPKVLQQ